MIQVNQSQKFYDIDLSLKDLIALKKIKDPFQLHKRQIKFPTNSQLNFNNEQKAASYGRGMEFAGVRSYQIGDDTRRMDWRLTARTGKPHTKLFQEEKERPVYLLVNLTSSMQFGTQITFKSCVAIQVAAIIAWNAVQNKDWIGGFIFNDDKLHFVKPAASNRNILSFFKKMLELNKLNPIINNENSHSIAARLLLYRNVIKRNSKIFVMSDFMNFTQADKSYFSLLANYNDVHFFHIYDVVEAEPPVPNCYIVTGSNKIFEFDSANTIFQDQYRKSFEKPLQDLKNFCVKNAIKFNSIRTDSDILKHSLI